MNYTKAPPKMSLANSDPTFTNTTDPPKMSLPIPNVSTDTVDTYIESIINATANASPPSSSKTKIPKVREMVRKPGDYEKYYVPKVVSIGPYHFGNKELQSVEKLKAFYTSKLLEGNHGAIRRLYNKLGESEMVEDLRRYYEKDSTTKYSNMAFTYMMLLDACFILYFILFIFGGESNDCTPELKSMIFFVHQDLFLLENQIPFKVLIEVIEVMSIMSKTACYNRIKSFIYGSILAAGKPKGLLKSIFCWPGEPKRLNRLIEAEPNESEPYHLLHLLQRRLTKTFRVPMDDAGISKNVRCNFQNATELVDVGIRFKTNDTMSSTRIEYVKGWFGVSANVALPPINVNDSTKPMLLNLMVYEAWWCLSHDAWVTSYVSLLDALIDDAKDVKVLRKAWVLQTSFYSDKEIADLVSEIAMDLVPNNVHYMEAKTKIQRHYESWRNTLFSQLKNEYFTSPWAIFALLGALIALFLGAVDTYYTVWGPESTCEDLCGLLKMNHRL